MVVLCNKSKDLVTINNYKYKGFYEVNRLPFGLASAPSCLSVTSYVVCLEYHRRQSHDKENDQEVPGDSGSCSHMVGRSRSTTQARQMHILDVYSEIPWLQDHGTRSHL